MDNYTIAELEEAREALSSTLHKCEKVQESTKLGKSQRTLLTRRIKAVQISLLLIEQSLQKNKRKEYTLKQRGTVLVVSDIERSKDFYKTILGLDVVLDFGANLTLSSGLSLQTMDSWKKFTGGLSVNTYGNDAEICFEAVNFNSFIGDLTNVQLVHPPYEHSWGQRIVRFYDPDGHIIEVGENMSVVVKRFIDSGMTITETSARMDVPESYITEQLSLIKDF